MIYQEDGMWRKEYFFFFFFIGKLKKLDSSDYGQQHMNMI
jgi:hypothetical protein